MGFFTSKSYRSLQIAFVNVFIFWGDEMSVNKLLCCTAAIMWTIDLRWSYLFLSYWAVWYRRKWSNKLVVLVTSLWQQMQGTVDTEQLLVNIIVLAGEIIPDNWRCFSFWHQVFIFSFSLSLSLVVAHFSMLLPATHSMCKGVVCFGTLNKN